MTASTLPGPRPQPLGALPWPAGMLLLPEGADLLAAELVRGAEPTQWPPGTEFLRRALDEEVDAAVAGLAGDTVVDRYNRAVLIGGDGDWEALAQETEAKAGS